ncbi:MAG: chloride channel protein [Chitinispirillaceae bacterium]
MQQKKKPDILQHPIRIARFGLFRFRDDLFLKLPIKWRMIVTACIIGLLTGLSAVVFYKALHGLTDFLFSLPGYWAFILPATGAFLSGVVVYKLAPEAEGHGIDAVAKSFHQQGGKVPLRVSAVKAVASILTMGSGGSGGVEGPIAQIGSGIGSTIARTLGFRTSHLRSLMLAGCAGGIGALFKAPLGGAFAAIEIIYKEDFESRALVPSVVSSVTSYFVFMQFVPGRNVLALPSSLFSSYKELPAYAILALAAVLAGFIFVKSFFSVNQFFRKLNVSKYLKPALGGLAVGVIGYFFPRAMGADLQPLIELCNSGFSLSFIAALLMCKIAATSFTVGSGGSGGVFGPSLFIGGMTGALVHKLLALGGYPLPLPSETAFVLVGMAAFFSGVAKAPIGALIMACEMTGSFTLLIPTLVVNTSAVFLSHSFGIYKNQVQDRFHSPTYLRGMSEFILKKIPIRDFLTTADTLNSIDESTTALEAHASLDIRRMTFPLPVTNRNCELVGLITSNAFINWTKRNDSSRVAEIMEMPAYCYADQTMYDALIRFRSSNFEYLPVLDRSTGEILGTIRYQDFLEAYHNVPVENFSEVEV